MKKKQSKLSRAEIRAFGEGLAKAVDLFRDMSPEGEDRRLEVRNRVMAESALHKVATFGLRWVIKEAQSNIYFGIPRPSMREDLIYGISEGLYSAKDVAQAQKSYKASQHK